MNEKIIGQLNGLGECYPGGVAQEICNDAVAEIARLQAIVEADNDYFCLMQRQALRNCRGPVVEISKQAMMDAWGKCVAARDIPTRDAAEVARDSNV